MIEPIIEAISTAAEAKISVSPTPINPNLLLVAEQHKLGESTLSIDNNSLNSYIRHLKTNSPNKPPLVSQHELSLVIKKDHEEVTAESPIGKKMSWYLSKFLNSTYKTRLCSRENPSKDGIIKSISGHVIENSNIETLNTSAEKEKAVKYTGEILKMYINTKSYLEAQDPGSSHINLSWKAQYDLELKFDQPEELVGNVGTLLTPPVGYVLTDSGQFALNPRIWNDLSGISKDNAEKTVAHITTSFNDINKVYNTMCRGIDTESRTPGTLPMPRPSLVDFIKDLNRNVRETRVNPFTSINRRDSKIVTYQYIGGGIVVICIAGSTIYFNMQDSSQNPQTIPDALRGIVKSFGKLMITASKK